jgi:hypothetical protein
MVGMSNLREPGSWPRESSFVEEEGWIMKQTFAAASVLVVVLVLAGCAPESGGYYGRHRSPAVDSLALMTRADIIKLSQSKVGDGVIINMINTTGSSFVLRTSDVVELADSGVSDSVITAMIKTGEEPQDRRLTRGYDWHPVWYAGVWYPFWGPGYSSGYYDFWPGYYRPFYGGYYGGGLHMGGGHHGSAGRHR